MGYIEDNKEIAKYAKSLVARCVLSNSFDERMKYGDKLNEFIESSEENINNAIKEATKQKKEINRWFDRWLADIVDKTTKAAQTIKDQNDWIDYLYIAMEDNKDDILKKAMLEKKAVDNYKNKKYK